MLFVFEMGAAGLVCVPFRFELPQFGDDAVGCIDCICAGAHLPHMHGHAAHLDLEPEDAGIGAHQHFFFRLGNENRVRLVAAQMRHQRAVAGRLFFDH